MARRSRGVERFEPRFSYTHTMVRNLTEISEARAVVLNARLVPKWEVSLRREALLRTAHHSTAIEGNPLSLEDVTALAQGRKVMATRKAKQEVLNYLSALEEVPTLAKRERFTPHDLLAVHRTICQGTLEDPKDEGAFRRRQVVVANSATGEVVFTPPPTAEVPRLVDGFLHWFGSKDAERLDPVILAGVTHYRLVWIHPFADGNGRTARALATIALYKRGFDVKRFFALDDYYDQDRRSYYAALRAVDQRTLDLTGWLEYFTTGVAVSISSVKDRVIGISRDVKALSQTGQVALSDRQMRIVERMVDSGAITNREVREMFGVSNRAALDELERLIEMDVVRKTGKGRSVRYVLV
jgi:Fic family protein